MSDASNENDATDTLDNRNDAYDPVEEALQTYRKDPGFTNARQLKRLVNDAFSDGQLNNVDLLLDREWLIGNISAFSTHDCRDDWKSGFRLDRADSVVYQRDRDSIAIVVGPSDDTERGRKVQVNLPIEALGRMLTLAYRTKRAAW